MADSIVMSFGVPNYSGMLFNKGNTRTPLSALIGGRQKLSNSVEFAVGQHYTSGHTVGQPEISETASLTAPDATKTTRTQMTNVCQIFQETVYVSDAKLSNMGTLSGLNVVNQQANPQNEVDFQVGVKMQDIANDIEYTFINGAYNKATSDTTVNKTRGLVTAATSNVIAMGSKPLGFWNVADMLKKIDESNAATEGLLLCVDATTRLQLNADALQNGGTIVPSERVVNGIALDRLETPLGVIYLRTFQYLPAGTALVLNVDVLSPVGMNVPGKGNFYLEELARTGAGTKYQIFGQMGLDHGPEWYHGKFTGIKQTFAIPTSEKHVYITNSTSDPVNTKEVGAGS